MISGKELDHGPIRRAAALSVSVALHCGVLVLLIASVVSSPRLAPIRITPQMLLPGEKAQRVHIQAPQPAGRPAIANQLTYQMRKRAREAAIAKVERAKMMHNAQAFTKVM